MKCHHGCEYTDVGGDHKASRSSFTYWWKFGWVICRHAFPVDIPGTLSVLMSIWHHRITKQLKLERSSERSPAQNKISCEIRPDYLGVFYIQFYIPLIFLPIPLISLFAQQKAFLKTGEWVGKEGLECMKLSNTCKFISVLGISPIFNP